YVKFLMKDFDGSLADVNRALEINPNNARAYGDRALALYAKGNDAAADEDLKKCFALDASLRPFYEKVVSAIKQNRGRS
ncbi:MAG TPA: hypothetical protein VE961_20960, partial [Pyrinomonadaceae bacterium]|nr:hypothetical protein [Pyrinomonadaceae bacterium]